MKRLARWKGHSVRGSGREWRWGGKGRTRQGLELQAKWTELLDSQCHTQACLCAFVYAIPPAHEAHLPLSIHLNPPTVKGHPNPSSSRHQCSLNGSSLSNSNRTCTEYLLLSALPESAPRALCASPHLLHLAACRKQDNHPTLKRRKLRPGEVAPKLPAKGGQERRPLL